MRMVAKIEPTRTELSELLDYTETSFSNGAYNYTGGFVWRQSAWGRNSNIRKRVRDHGVAFAGGYFTNKRSGVRYACIRFRGRAYLTHRLVWVWHHGEIPDGMVVDHINLNTLDNRVSNLRLVTHAQNHLNRSSYVGSTSTYVGVHFRSDRAKWSASIRVDGKVKRLGNYETELEAALARDAAAKEIYGEFAHLNFSQGVYSTKSTLDPNQEDLL